MRHVGYFSAIFTLPEGLGLDEVLFRDLRNTGYFG